MNMDWNYKDLFEWGRERLKIAKVPDAELDARLLLEWVCKTDRNTLLVHGDRIIGSEEYSSYVNCISMREKRRPLQYITGFQEFMGLEFEVDENVLVPRQDTEILVEEVLKHLHDGMRILDMCTGSGCILLSLLYYSNYCTGLGVDISDAALKVARRNAQRLDSIRNGIDVEFIQGDLFKGLCNNKSAHGEAKEPKMCEDDKNISKFEIIVSNPPYIKSGEIEALMPEVSSYEPKSALDGGDDGLYFYREIVKSAGDYLTGGGELFFEIGSEQGACVKNLMESAGYSGIEIVKDYAGFDRVVHGTWIMK